MVVLPLLPLLLLLLLLLRLRRPLWRWQLDAGLLARPVILWVDAGSDGLPQRGGL